MYVDKVIYRKKEWEMYNKERNKGVKKIITLPFLLFLKGIKICVPFLAFFSGSESFESHFDSGSPSLSIIEVLWKEKNDICL